MCCSEQASFIFIPRYKIMAASVSLVYLVCVTAENLSHLW